MNNPVVETKSKQFEAPENTMRKAVKIVELPVTEDYEELEIEDADIQDADIQDADIEDAGVSSDFDEDEEEYF